MKHRVIPGLVSVALLVVSQSVAGKAHAALLWYGDPAEGTKVFGSLEPHEGTITVASDPQQGQVFRYHKPSGSHRCESRGASGVKAKEGDLLYIAWKFMVQMPQTTTTNAIFQWKAYPADEQNYPIVLKTLSGKLWLEQYNPNGTQGLGKTAASENVRNGVWSADFVPGVWHSVVLVIKCSKDVKQGYIEFWHNGALQTLRNNSTRFVCRTLDGDVTDPKWGIYGADAADASNYVTGQRIGTDMASVSSGSVFARVPPTSPRAGVETVSWDAMGRLLPEFPDRSGNLMVPIFSTPVSR